MKRIDTNDMRYRTGRADALAGRCKVAVCSEEYKAGYRVGERIRTRQQDCVNLGQFEAGALRRDQRKGPMS